MPNPSITVKTSATFQNWHLTSSVGGPVGKLFIPFNAWTDNSAVPADQPFAPGLAGLKSIVQQAEAASMRVRALGSRWSLNNIAYVKDYLIDTANLTSLMVGFSANSIDPGFQGNKDFVVFAQCGATISKLNNDLANWSPPLALPTSGASNGQTIAGAMSTGTHGSANAVGGIPDYVLGLHIIGEGGKDYWVERASQPVMSQAFVNGLGAALIRDDDLFLSAVVGFGSFGLIHAVLLQAEPLYLLELFIKQYDFSQVLHAALTLDMSALGLPDGATLPFHFEVDINPYKRQAGGGGAIVRAIYKRTFVPPMPAPPPTQGGSIRSADLVSLAGTFSDIAPGGLIGDILQGQMLSAAQPTAPGTIVTIPGLQFGDTQPTGGGTSVELGVPLDRLGDALDAIWSVTDVQPFGAPVALRYVKASEALLAFTCFTPLTCTIEMPGIDSATARAAHAAIWTALDTGGIPHTFHWGQQAPFTNTSVVNGFGLGRVNRWLAARHNFLKTAAGRRMFSNDVLDACGLSL
jgi:hypothetical protein